MKKTLLWLTPVFLFPVLLGCSGGASSGMTNVTVALGPLPSPAAPATAGKAPARSLRSGAVLPRATPPGLDNILLTVTGDGMTPIETVITLSGSWDPADPTVVLLVPSGNNRRFLAEAWGGGEILYRGDNTVTLTGAPTTVDIYVNPPWRPTLDDTAYGNTPSARYHHTAVWTGAEMIVWGGLGADNYYSLVTGARYDPVADTWVPTSTGFWTDSNGLESHTAVWTGTEMIVWGGGSYPGNEENYGARYDPALDSWQSTSQDGVPFARRGHTAVWTGTEMIVWGGYGYDGSSWMEFNDGARYDPVADSWVNLDAAYGSPPDIRTRHTAVWTGTEMIVWGGYANPEGYVYYNDGGRYDPVTETWSYISGSLTDAPSERSDHTAVWTGTEMIVWGGEYDPDGVTSLNDGARYTPGSDSWSVMNSVDAPYERSRHTAVWTGTQMIVWGGEYMNYGSIDYLYNDGGRYDPGSDTWTQTSMFGAVPTPRYAHTAVWAATQMIVWGGTDDGYAGGYVSSGGRYTPW